MDLNCSVCLEIFHPPIRMLDCGHNYCEKCIDTIIASLPQGGRYWYCPQCRAEQNKRAYQYPQNLFIEQAVAYFKTKVGNDGTICELHNKANELCKY